ncbi:uncharacterized protein TNCV_2065341 [Trichonephila clavipes]|nr:uncharacterized protein TNCV_2065341 [Trichonephila clavipes]
MITFLVQRLRDTGSVADKKRSGRAFRMKTKVADVETDLQRSPLKRPSVYINIHTEFISLLKVMKGMLGCSKMAQCVRHHGEHIESSIRSVGYMAALDGDTPSNTTSYRVNEGTDSDWRNNFPFKTEELFGYIGGLKGCWLAISVWASVGIFENIYRKIVQIPTQLACAYLKGHLTGRSLDWFDVIGYRVVEDKATDYAHLQQALTEQFPVDRNRSELETRFNASFQNHNQKPSDFVYELLKIHKQLKLDMREETLRDHVISRLEP